MLHQHEYKCRDVDPHTPTSERHNPTGIGAVGKLELATSEQMDRMYNVNVKGVFHCLQVTMLCGAGQPPPSEQQQQIQLPLAACYSIGALAPPVE